jgi:hypothetical protein
MIDSEVFIFYASAIRPEADILVQACRLEPGGVFVSTKTPQ